MCAATVDNQQLLSRLRSLASSASSEQGGGVTRLAWSSADLSARALLTGWAAEAELQTSCDAVGNLLAELPGTDCLAPLVVGSHLDSVVDGGALDGAYGTLAAFELLAALKRSGEQLRHPVRAVAFVNEEGVVAPAFTGSLAVTGKAIDLEAIGPDGLSLAGRIGKSGGRVAALESALWQEIAGYLELHIEQGPVLDHLGVPIGVVTGITGCLRGWITFEGRANHAGTTPMALRQDALLAAARTVVAVDALARDGVVTVATSGALRVHPGNANVVAGHCEVSFDLRALEDAHTKRAFARLQREVSKIVETTSTTATIELTSSSKAVATDLLLRRAVTDAAAALGLVSTELASGAGHDAQHVAAIGPVGMVFVPSIGGVSHSPDEATAEGDLVAGVEVLLGALRLADTRLD